MNLIDGINWIKFDIGIAFIFSYQNSTTCKSLNADTIADDRPYLRAAKMIPTFRKIILDPIWFNKNINDHQVLFSFNCFGQTNTS